MLLGLLDGAIIALMALENKENPTEEYKKMWLRLKLEDFIGKHDGIPEKGDLTSKELRGKLVQARMKSKGGFSMEPLKNFFRENFDGEKIMASNVKAGITVVNLKTLTPEVIWVDDLNTVEQCYNAVAGSSSLPVVFQPAIVQRGDGTEIKVMDGGTFAYTNYNARLDPKLKDFINHRAFILFGEGPGLTQKTIGAEGAIDGPDEEYVPEANYVPVHSPIPLNALMSNDPERSERNFMLGWYEAKKVAFSKYNGHRYYFPIEEYQKMLEVFPVDALRVLEEVAEQYGMNIAQEWTADKFLGELYKKRQEKQSGNSKGSKDAEVEIPLRRLDKYMQGNYIPKKINGFFYKFDIAEYQGLIRTLGVDTLVELERIAKEDMRLPDKDPCTGQAYTGNHFLNILHRFYEEKGLKRPEVTNEPAKAEKSVAHQAFYKKERALITLHQHVEDMRKMTAQRNREDDAEEIE